MLNKESRMASRFDNKITLNPDIEHNSLSGCRFVTHILHTDKIEEQVKEAASFSNKNVFYEYRTACEGDIDLLGRRLTFGNTDFSEDFKKKCGSIWYNGDGIDLSEFWRIFDALRGRHNLL